MTDTQEIKNRLDLVDVVQDYGVQLRKSGRNYAGFCPFHPNTRTPAFYVFPERQTWRCFGACAEGGDVFSFVMKKNGWDFKETLVELARRAGVTLEETRPKDAAREAAEERLTGLLDAASNYYHQLLLHAPQAEAARRYVAGRDLTGETVAAFRLGFALDSWDAARTHFTGQGYSEDELLAVGLLTEHEERHTRYDRFRGRLMIPIRDLDGRVVGFGARSLDPDGIPKYLNSPQTAHFDKGHLIFGLDMAKRHIREAREVVLVEGYLDVMTAWQHGFRNVVAQMGTALTETQLRIIERFATRRIIIALDADAAGIKAMDRDREIARVALKRDYDPIFSPTGISQFWIGRLNTDIHIVLLPDGYDPDKLIRTNPSDWPVLLSKSEPVVKYVINRLIASVDKDDIKGKSTIARQVLPLISDIDDPIERDQYLTFLARRLAVNEDALRQEQAKLRRQGIETAKRKSQTKPKEDHPTNLHSSKANSDKSAAENQSFVPPEPDMPLDDFGAPARGTLNSGTGKIATRRLRHSPRLEENFLRQCLEHPGALSAVNYLLSRHKQPEVSTVDFVRVEDKVLLGIIADRATMPTVATIDELCDSLDSVIAQRVKALFDKPSTLGKKLDRLPDSLALSVLDWRLEKIREQNTILKQLLPSGSQIGSQDELTQSYLDQVQEMKRINRARDAMSATGRRRAEEGLSGRKPR